MRRVAGVVVALLSVACRNEALAPAPAEPAKATPPASAPAESAAVAPNPNAPKRLPFEIVKVYLNQQEQRSAPWHTSGGDWTFFDAKTPGGATFLVGLPPKMAPSTKSLAHDQAVIAAADRTSGAKLVEELAQALGVAVPAKGAEKHPAPLEVATTVLTENAMRNEKGDFGGVGGGWTATTWDVPEGADDPGEIRFNYSLSEKKGEFTERDAESDNAVVQQFARALRDGTD